MFRSSAARRAAFHPPAPAAPCASPRSQSPPPLRSVPPRRPCWAWMRKTPAGFRWSSKTRACCFPGKVRPRAAAVPFPSGLRIAVPPLPIAGHAGKRKKEFHRPRPCGGGSHLRLFQRAGGSPRGLRLPRQPDRLPGPQPRPAGAISRQLAAGLQLGRIPAACS